MFSLEVCHGDFEWPAPDQHVTAAATRVHRTPKNRRHARSRISRIAIHRVVTKIIVIQHQSHRPPIGQKGKRTCAGG